MSHTNHAVAERQESSSPKPSYYLEDGFFHGADDLRAQFERLMSMAVPANNGLTPLSYAFCRNAYQFLTASAERIFEADLLEDLIHALHAWSGRVLGTSHVSTPQLRVFIHGCCRNLLRDDVSAQWRYALSLTKNLRPRKMGPLNLLSGGISSSARQDLVVKKLMNTHLSFNQILVHRTSNPYSIAAEKLSMDPLEGVIFLDGYFW